MRCLAKDARERFADFASVRERLSQLFYAVHRSTGSPGRGRQLHLARAARKQGDKPERHWATRG